MGVGSGVNGQGVGATVEDGVWLGEMHDKCGLHVGGKDKGIVALGLVERARTTEKSHGGESRCSSRGSAAEPSIARLGVVKVFVKV